MRREIKFTPMLGLLGAAALAAAVVSLPARSAQAYGEGIDINKFHPAPGNEKILSVDLADVGPHLQVVPQLFLHYSYRPLVYTLGGVPQADLVRHRLTGDLSVSLALWRRLQIAIALPVTFYQAGETPPNGFVTDPNNPTGRTPNTSLATAGQEDIHLLVKGVFWNNRTFEIAGAHFGVGGIADLSLPSGNAASYLGARLPTLALKAVGHVNWRRLTASLVFGGLFQSSDPAKDQLYDVKSGLGIVFGGGLQIEMFRYRIMPFYILAEVFGASVLSDPRLISPKNTPAELSIAFKTSYKEWTFMLGGGPGVSPGAGVPDGRVFAGATYAWQRIPQKPKPERVHDECPNLEGAQQYLPPGMIKDKDGNCVMPPDECPNLPGAQEVVPAGLKKDDAGNCVPPPIVLPPTCPPDQELNKATGGCEDKPKVTVHIDPKLRKLVLSERIFFDFDKDTIKPVSFPILDEVVRVLKVRPDIKRMRIEGHTDNKGSDSYNIDLSHRRAASVMVYLIEHGVETFRLTSSGFGFRCPIVANDNPDNRAQNRRVDFIILEQDGVPSEDPKCKIPQMPRR
jgi:outer membrane protein OmpA-like peptidoglycan-associated protein